MDFPPNEAVSVVGFSLYPRHIEMLNTLTEQYKAPNRSALLRKLIEQEYDRSQQRKND